MNSETLLKRISSNEENLKKLNKKLERILKAEESNYEKDNPYYYSDYDKKYTLKEIESLQQKLEQYKKELQICIEKEKSRNIPIIIDFLNQWQINVYSHYEKDILEAKNMHDKVCALYPDYNSTDEEKEIFKAIHKEYYSYLYGVYEYKEYDLPFKHKEKIKISNGKWEYITPYFSSNNIQEGLDKLKKDLKQEADRKYDFIIERTNKIVGEIKDVSDLHIGENGELNGVIIGTRGKAMITSTGCAGYNIQIFHFRVYVTKLK